MKTIKNINLFVIIILVVCSLNGCYFSLETLLAGRRAKQELLNEKLKFYHQALYWGDKNKAVLVVHPKNHRKIALELHDRFAKERIIDTEVIHVQYSPYKDEVTVDVEVRYFVVPAYKVLKRREVEQWVFDPYRAGWMLESHVRNTKSEEVKEAL